MSSNIKYAKNKDGQFVAYEVTGSGNLDIVFIPDWVSNLDVQREEPTVARFLDRLASFGRLICFDKRGSGLSDPVPLGAIPTPEEWMDDVRTVLDDIGSRHAVLFGHGEGTPMAILFAATHPDRTTALVLADGYSRRCRAADYPCGVPPDIVPKYIEYIISLWGSGKSTLNGAPGVAHKPNVIELRGKLERLSMSPGQFAAMYPPTYERDVRPALPTIRVPTLVLHRSENPYIRIGNGRYLAEHIQGARFVELDGSDHFYHAGDSTAFLDEVQKFLTGTTETPDHDRILATVLFTDIVAATELAERLGDIEWRSLLDRHHALVRKELARFRGQEIDTAGDGFFATFDGPARGVRCALAIRDVVRSLDIEIRAGLHTGECELMGDKVGGMAVHIGARIMGLTRPGKVLVSRTVKDLVVGSGLVFSKAGKYSLKGVADKWELFSAS